MGVYSPRQPPAPNPPAFAWARELEFSEATKKPLYGGLGFGFAGVLLVLVEGHAPGGLGLLLTFGGPLVVAALACLNLAFLVHVSSRAVRLVATLLLGSLACAVMTSWFMALTDGDLPRAPALLVATVLVLTLYALPFQQRE